MKGSNALLLAACVAAAMFIPTSARAQNGLVPTLNAGAGWPGVPWGGPPAISTASGVRWFQGSAAVRGPVTVSLGVPYLRAAVVRTDPLVRQIQAGPTPVGLLANVDPSTGLGIAGVPGAGERVVRAVGPVIETPAGPAVRAVDAATGVNFVALVPSPTPSEAPIPGPLVEARIVRVSGDSVILEREANGQTLTEIVPARNVYVEVQGRLVTAASVRRLRPGVEVLIPLAGESRGTIVVTPPRGFGTRASSASQSRRSR